MIAVSKEDQDKEKEAAYLSVVQSNDKSSDVIQTHSENDSQDDQNPLYAALGI